MTASSALPALPDERRPPKARNRPGAALFEPAILSRAVSRAFVKLDPRFMVHIPVMFVVEIGSVITSPTSPRRWPRAGARPRRTRSAAAAGRRSRTG